MTHIDRALVRTPGGITRNRPAYATMAITQRDSNDPSPLDIPVLAHPSGNSTLNPPAAPVAAGPGPFNGFYRVPGWVQEGAFKEITVSANSEFVIPVDGVYIIPIGWGGFRHSQNNATVGFVLGIERAGQVLFSQRPTSSKQPNTGDIENVSGGGQLNAKAGDLISVWLASDKVGTVTLGNANATIHLLEDTTGL